MQNAERTSLLWPAEYNAMIKAHDFMVTTLGPGVMLLMMKSEAADLSIPAMILTMLLLLENDTFSPEVSEVVSELLRGRALRYRCRVRAWN